MPWHIDQIGHDCHYMQTIHPSFCLRDGNPNHNNPIMSMSSNEKKQLFRDHIFQSIEFLENILQKDEDFINEGINIRI